MRKLLYIFLFISYIAYPQLPSGLNYYYPMDETTGTTGYSSVNTNNLTLTSVSFADGEPGELTGIKNGSYDFEGSTSSAEAQYSYTIGLSELTINLWLYPYESNSTNMILEETSSGYWQFAFTQGAWYTRDNSTGESGSRNNDLTMPLLTINNWQMITLKYSVSGSIKAIYKNGVLINSTSTSVDQLTNVRDLNYILIAASTSYPSYAGLIDEFGIWGRALSDVEISQLYDYYLTESTAPTHAYGLSGDFDFSIGISMSGGISQNELDPDYIMLKTWDFSGLTNGTWGESDFNSYFAPTVFAWEHGGQGSITDDTIDNNPVKVLQVQHLHDQYPGGVEFGADLQVEEDTLWISFSYYQSPNFQSSAGGKIPGLSIWPRGCDQCSESTCGAVSHLMFKQGHRIVAYHYDKTSGVYCNHATDEWIASGKTYYYNPNFKFSNGTWYRITQCLIRNTFTGGVANSDGEHRVWVNDSLIIRHIGEKFVTDQNLGIDGMRFASFFGGSAEDTADYLPLYTCHNRFANINIFSKQLPTDDYVITNYPGRLSNRDFYYKNLITTSGTLQNSQYGGNYGNGIEETYLIDAGAGNTVTYNYTYSIGSGDFLLMYDGKTTDADLVRNIAGTASGSGSVTSSDRYLFVRFITDKTGVGTGFTGTH